ncbi:hypothetical protein PFISCL1PPCAC_2356, partial [Pristionchus fissidentatus]
FSNRRPGWRTSHRTMNRGHRPPGLPRLQKSKIRLCARLSSHDLRPGSLSFCTTTNQILLPHTAKSHSKHAFDTVFTPDCAQSEISSSLLPDLLHGLISGIDSCLISFGGSSSTKNSALFSSISDQQGLFQSTIAYLFPIIDKSVEAIKNGCIVKISALHYSQRTDAITDLLSQFNTDPRRFPVRMVEDALEGPRVENASEIRVDSIDQAMFYLNTVIDYRLIEEEETQRLSHLFFTLTLCMGERRTSFHLIDLGMGERNSQRGSLSMPAIGNVLISLTQGQKSLPNRDSPLCQLLRCGVGRCRQTTILCSFADRRDENENILQLASKLSKARKTPRRVRGMADSSSVSSSERKKRSDLESSSEQSAAETVIFIGRRSSGKFRESRIPIGESALKPLQLHMSSSPLHLPHSSPSRSSLQSPSHEHSLQPGTSVAPLLKGYTPFFSPYSRVYEEMCSPPGTSKGIIDDDDEDPPGFVLNGVAKISRLDFGVTIEGEVKKDRQAEEEEKRRSILLWMEESNAVGRERLASDDEDEEEDESFETEREIRLPRPLEDIQELDEDSLRESMRSNAGSVTIANGKHPLSILSREALDTVEFNDGGSFEADDDLERAMGASISSIVSHELLQRVKGELMRENSRTSSMFSMDEEPSEMDVYRRASHLEEYGNERLKELTEAERLRRKKRLGLCCTSMASSTSTERKDEEERKEELRKRREELKEEEEELKKRREEIKRQLEPPLLKQLTAQISNFTLKAAGLKRVNHPSDSLPTTPTISSRKVLLPARTPSLSNCSSPIHRSKSSLPVRKERRSSKGRLSKEREEKEKKTEEVVTPSHSNLSLRSPYSKITPARLPSGAESSGRGSDDNGSSVVSGKKINKRESYSASSGYESATGDYRYYSRNDKNDRFRVIEKRCGIAAKESDRLREKQRLLQQDLRDAKERIGERVEEWRGSLEGKSALSHTTLLDTLMQENRILEKRLVACQNHTMLVTSLL